ncbi:acyl-CoA dehydrogenase [Desulfosporosinus orientis DSM 765]|uniref:3-methylmercaptopropionyl-CoA dehydrogenase n=1 Tax=Desulfosporosinus orientis (strain ATCC 19365 / DSM 765 / NCIMB 8382 / VKM B-1628 / Singapore I) TaxID=768706 RepID=G7WGL1_DESOD|nr:acyl-CoA dehydrogenase [Desulfosporosinus orientis]AET68088.1 acyl-CoA dehydrogenase [Desulfosporosinus orientis DSM 765]
MGNKLCDLKDARFILYEQLNVEELCKSERYGDHSLETFEMTINAAEKVAVNDFAPANNPGDIQGCTWNNGKVKVPDVYHKPFQKLCDGGWFCVHESYDVGGQNLPHVIDYVCKQLFFAANHSLTGYYGLTHSAAKVIEVFGTEEQKKKYMLPLYAGTYGGTMCLTESQAGSDVGAVKTKARKNEDGTYSISGGKIFITGGESNLTENIIHIVLARIEGDPEGTKGLSCFVVPKIRINNDGSLGAVNDVSCVGIEHKMGMKGSATSVLAFGENGNCIGELLGQERNGIVTMFNMMNEQRLLVGLQGLAQGSTAYLHALNYARERKQGLRLSKKGLGQEPIIVHSDVKTNLLWMKCYTEGMRALILYTIYCMDKMVVCKDDADAEEKRKYSDIIEVLTPICKAYGSDKGFEVCVKAIQVHGGYGYCSEYLVEQFARDSKITSIYEGTNGIQSLDLIGRKLNLKKGDAYKAIITQVYETIQEALEVAELAPYAKELSMYLSTLEEVSDQIKTLKSQEDLLLTYSWAQTYLEIWGDLMVGWMFLWQSVIASKKMRETFKEDHSDTVFYIGKIVTAKYYLGTILPAVTGKFQAIKKSDRAFLEMKEEYF